MGIRETLNQNQSLTTALTVGILVVALILIGLQLFGGRQGAGGGQQYWYTTDGGQTRTAGSPDEIYTLDSGGQPRVRAHVYRVGNGEPFVAYLERLDPRAVQQLQALGDDMESQYRREQLMMTGLQVRHPQQERWFSIMSPEGQRIIAIEPRDGQHPSPVWP